MTFGKWLAENRNKARLTQAQLAERSGISPNYVSALERDEPNARDGSPRRPRLDKVDRIAKALNVPQNEARQAAGYAPQTSPHNIAGFTVLSDAISASHGSLGVCAVYANGLRVLLRTNITIAEFDRVAREHRDLFKQLGRKVAWYEQICD